MASIHVAYNNQEASQLVATLQVYSLRASSSLFAQVAATGPSWTSCGKKSTVCS